MDFGRDGQEAIRSSRVLVVGAGGLGCPVIQYLAAAGIGTLGIADYDVVELSNLQRQVIYGEADVGRSKAELAGAYAARLHTETDVKIINSRITADNVQQIVYDFDIVVDCTDNFPTRYHLNDACVLEGKSMVYGSLFRFEGQVSVFNAPQQNGNRGPNY
ncbi:MAG: HesA/MoeB/ThiF family protein, partial [Balneolales bacterium]